MYEFVPDPKRADEDLVSFAEWPLESPNFEEMAKTTERNVQILNRINRSYALADMAIHKDDEMWNGLVMTLDPSHVPYARLHYSYGGRSALRNIGSALVAGQLPIPKRILDFPSSHGRVTRYLAKAFPEAEIFAGDVNKGGVDFCAKRFGATPVYSDYDLGKVSLPSKLDLIWCSSLVSHLNLDQCEQLFNMFVDSLAPNGILGMTWCSRGLDYAHDTMFKTINDELMASIRTQVKEQGAGFATYPGWDEGSYGMTFVTLGWLEKIIKKRNDALILSYEEKGWHGGQDTLWIIKRDISHWYHWALDN